MNDSHFIETIRRRPPRREHLVNGDSAAIFTALESGEVDFVQAARMRGLTYEAAFRAYQAAAREQRVAEVRRARLSMTPPRWPSPAKKAA